MGAEKRVPALRFPDFAGEWDTENIEDLLTRIVEPVDVQAEKIYREIGVKSHGRGLFHKDPVLGKALGEKRVYWVHPNAFVLNIVFAWEQAIALTSDAEKGFIASHRFPMFVPVEDKADLGFVREYFLRKRGKQLLKLASPGGAGRNRTLGQNEFAKLKVTFPKRQEQAKIAAVLGAVGEKLEKLQRKRDLLAEYKRGVVQKIFSQQVRFKADDGADFPDWEEKELGEVLEYEQPTKYLVESTEYQEQFPTPVLTAGKTFVLGYTDETTGIFTHGLPVIIFDDFTTASQFVDFPFKAKSSAMKILKRKDQEDSIKLIYEFMRMIRFPIGEHKRYWISEFQLMPIPLPHPDEQKKIANFLFAIDAKIQALVSQIRQMEVFKEGLLQQMFV